MAIQDGVFAGTFFISSCGCNVCLFVIDPKHKALALSCPTLYVTIWYCDADQLIGN